ncbi:MAG: DUF3099 domain-containing protein [Microbacteriaceae bacterium]|nr:DUF3099 domain-containing protein [Microbacteriaceae bacterium]
MKKQKITISSLQAKAEDHDRRKRDYLIAMCIRVICILVIPFVHGWWMIIPALGAIFIPYFAVIVANVATLPAKNNLIPHEIEASRKDSQSND